METLNNLPESVFWQPSNKIKEDLRELAVKAIVELKEANRFNAALAIEELFNIDKNDIPEIRKNI